MVRVLFHQLHFLLGICFQSTSPDDQLSCWKGSHRCYLPREDDSTFGDVHLYIKSWDNFSFLSHRSSKDDQIVPSHPAIKGMHSCIIWTFKFIFIFEGVYSSPSRGERAFVSLCQKSSGFFYVLGIFLTNQLGKLAWRIYKEIDPHFVLFMSVWSFKHSTAIIFLDSDDGFSSIISITVSYWAFGVVPIDS